MNTEIYDYIRTYPFPAINLETLQKGINERYNTNYTLSDIEDIICKFFIIHFEERNTIPETQKELDFYNWVNLNEPCCNSTGDCKTCTSYSLCIQAPEVYNPNTDWENEEVIL